MISRYFSLAVFFFLNFLQCELETLILYPLESISRQSYVYILKCQGSPTLYDTVWKIKKYSTTIRRFHVKINCQMEPNHFWNATKIDFTKNLSILAEKILNFYTVYSDTKYWYVFCWGYMNYTLYESRKMKYDCSAMTSER